MPTLLQNMLEAFTTAADRRDDEVPPSEVASDEFLRFCRRRSVPRWQEGPHHALICSVIQRAITTAMLGRGIKVILEAPPRHGKSHVTSVLGPAWGMGRFPDMQVILTSYGSKLATSKAGAARNLIESMGMREFGVSVDHRSKAKNDWKLAGRRARMIAAGVAGPVTGEGANLGIIDDPVKNWREAHSPVRREEVWEWYRTTFSTRIERGGSVVLMLTRWHEYDLAGKLIEEFGTVEEGGEWTVIRLPAISEGPATDPLGRAVGEALWPERWPIEALRERKRILGDYAFAALFQQTPRPEGGNLIKRHNFRYAKRVTRELVEEDPETQRPMKVQVKGFELAFQGEKGPEVEWVRQDKCWALVSGDLALSLEQSADFTALGVWYITPLIRGSRRRILVYVVHERLDSPSQVPRLRRLWEDFRPRVIAIEKGTADLATIQHAKKAGLPIQAVPLDGDKLARGLPLQAAYQDERIFHLAGQGWVAECEDEITRFPNAPHDDVFDMASCMENVMRELELLPQPKVFVAGKNVHPSKLQKPKGKG